MRQKRRGIAKPPTSDDSPDFDLGASARQIGLIESGNGFQQGPLAIAMALIAALSLTGIRAWWRANTRTQDDHR